MVYLIEFDNGKVGIYEADSLIEAIQDCLYVEQIQEHDIQQIKAVD